MRSLARAVILALVALVHDASADQLSAGEVQSVVTANRAGMKACYEQARRAVPDLHVRLRVHLVVEPSGHVSRATDDAPDAGTDAPTAAVRACVLDIFRGATFPKADDRTNLMIPVTFIPSDVDAGGRDARAD
jgi:hypothetical protein